MTVCVTGLADVPGAPAEEVLKVRMFEMVAVDAARTSRRHRSRLPQRRNRMNPMTETTAPAGFRPKKSVALSGVTAGNTALCTVGRTGNDLHYRGYDILDVAEACEFEEIAHLLVHGKLPTTRRTQGLQGTARGAARPAREREAKRSRALPAGAHPMDVMRTGVSALGRALPEKDDHNRRARATSPTG